MPEGPRFAAQFFEEPPVSVHELPNQFAAIEMEAVHALCAVGFDALFCSSESALKGGVSVRVGARDPRLQWTSNRADAAPVGHFYSSYDHTFVLHAGRVVGAHDVPRLQDFVSALVVHSDIAAVA